MVQAYTIKYTRIGSGFMGQLVEWPEAISEGATLDECRSMVEDALAEMIAAYKEQNKPIPPGGSLQELITVET